MSEAFQQVYLEEEPPEQPVNVHLLPYPIQVDLSHIENCLIQNQVLKVSRVQVESDGAVNALPGWENFPDTQVPLSLSSSGVHWGWDFKPAPGKSCFYLVLLHSHNLKHSHRHM